MENDLNTSNYDTALTYWLDTSPVVTLQAPNMNYGGCVVALNQWPTSLLRKGQNDNGDCTSMISSDCLSEMKEMALQGLASSQSPGNYSCLNFIRNFEDTPPEAACQKAIGKSWPGGILISTQFIGSTYDQCRPIYGNGTVNESILTSEIGNPIEGTPKSDLSSYDTGISTVSMLISVAFHNSTSNDTSTTAPWSDSRIVCVRPKNIVKGSRVPKGVANGFDGISSVGNRGADIAGSAALALAVIAAIAMLQ
jgi:hypothetical protein